MRYLSLYLPSLPTDRILRLMAASHTQKAPDTPLATIAKVKGAQRLVSLDARAGALGLRPGMGLADARAMHPALLVAEADGPAERQTLHHILDWCRRYTPLVAPDGAEGVMLDVSGVAHLFGGETALLDDMVQRLARQGFAARGGIGPSPEAAWAIARFSQKPILPETIENSRLPKIFADFPMAALNIADHVVADLAQAGLRRVGDLLMRPRAPIAARFGTGLLTRLDGLVGLAKSAISPQFAAPDFSAERRFADGLTQEAAILANIGVLAGDLCGLLEQHGVGARKLELTLFRVDGAVRRVVVGTGRPLRMPDIVMRLFNERLTALREDGFETGYGFDVMRLGALQVEHQAQHQGLMQEAALAGDAAASIGAQDTDVADLIDRLGARLGLRRITRLHMLDTHIPEFAVTSLPAARMRQRGLPECAVTGDVPDRPVRLLARPEPIDTIASVPDGPPMRFCWRRVMHQVVAIEGPERIAPEWWRASGKALTRDYFRAENEAGQRFWLFRQGLFDEMPAGAPEQPRDGFIPTSSTPIQSLPAWFMHGLFA